MTRQEHIRATGRNLARALGTVAIGLGILIGTMVGTASAQSGEAVTDYAAYPDALPVGCEGGSSVVTGLMFSNGRGGTATNLRNLVLSAGDTVTMQWDDFAATCMTADGTPLIAVGLATYRNESLHFDHTVNETVIDWSTCGAGTNPCVRSGGHYAVSVTIPANGVGPNCFLQIDALVGRPLAVVGPDGSYYNNLLRGGTGPDLLISARNFAVDCAEPVEITTVPLNIAETPTTVVTTTVPTTIAPTPSTVAPTPTTAPTKVLNTKVEVNPAPKTLPATGTSGSGPLTALAIALGASGVGLVRVSRRLA